MRTADVIVIGGGPAGATAARLLATWGHSVVLVTGPERRRSPGLAESLPPSIRKLLRHVGVIDRVDAAGFLRSDGNTSRWGHDTPRVETFAGPPDARGYQVHRPHFDRVLLECAVEAGAELRAGTVRAVELDTAGGARIEYASETGTHVVAGRYVLDCSGRAGIVARRGVRVPEPGHMTVALTAAWSREGGWPGVAPSHTLVETFDEGWVWSIPLSPSLRYVTVMVDAESARRPCPERSSFDKLRTNGRRAGTAGLEERYRFELGQTRALGALPSGAVQREAVWGCDASLYSARQYAQSRCLLVGDAGSFIDPLSSYGVKKALASAWMAAVAVHTSLVRPSSESMALDFFDQRERQVYASYLAQSVRYFREAARRHAGLFWQRRAATETHVDGWDVSEDALRDDPDVLRALADLKRRPAIRLRPSAGVRCEARPAIVGNEIVPDEALVGPAFTSGARMLGGVHLPTLVRMAPEVSQVPDLFERYNAAQTPVSLPDFLGALSALVGKGLLSFEQD